MSDPAPAFRKRPEGPLEEAEKYVRAMRETGQKIGADIIEAGFEDLRSRTRLEVSQTMLRVLRENQHQALADALVRRLGELWGKDFGPNLDNFYG